MRVFIRSRFARLTMRRFDDRLNKIDKSEREIRSLVRELVELDPNNPEDLMNYIDSKRQLLEKTDKMREDLGDACERYETQIDRGYDFEIEHPKFMREIKSYLMDGENIYGLPHDIR